MKAWDRVEANMIGGLQHNGLESGETASQTISCEPKPGTLSHPQQNLRKGTADSAL